MFAETSNNIFLPTDGFIVKLSPLIDDKVCAYIFHDLLLELKLCILVVAITELDAKDASEEPATFVATTVKV